MQPYSFCWPVFRPVAATCATFALAGCATLSSDGGFSSVEQTARERLGKEVRWAKTEVEQQTIAKRVDELIAKPLSVDDAVQIALINNRGLQASYFDLGLGESKRDLAQRSATLDTLRTASDTRKAYYLALAAEETVRYSRQVNEVAQISADLARRMQQVGNFNPLQQAREQGFYADATLNLARAEQARVAARERLTRLLGLWGRQAQFELPERLPDLPKAPIELPDVEQTALAQRIDLQMVRLETEALANTLGVARAEAIYMQAVNRAAEAAINARSEVREAYLGYRTNYDIARHYRDEIVPLRKRIADENQLRYNGMLIGVFELLTDARSQIASVNASIEALRDFWIAHADLEMALIGKPSMAAAPSGSAGLMTPAAGPAH
jgi:outer membrane protein TolC